MATAAGEFQLARVWYAELKRSGIQELVKRWQETGIINEANAKRFQDLVNAYASIVVGDRDAFEDFFEDEADLLKKNGKYDEFVIGIVRAIVNDDKSNESILVETVKKYFQKQFDDEKLKLGHVLGELDSILKPYGYGYEIIDGPMSVLWARYDGAYGAGRFNFDSVWYEKLEPYRGDFQAFYDGIIERGLLKDAGAADRFEDLVNAYANIISGDQDAFEDFFEDEADDESNRHKGFAKKILRADEAKLLLREVREYFNGQLSNLNCVVDLVQIWTWVQPGLKFSEKLKMSQIWC